MASRLEVIEAGPLSTIQDGGRFGSQRFGISPSGAMDALALRLANALVGNDRGAAGIEMTLAGMVLKVSSGRCHLAYAGASAPVAVDGVEVAPYRSILVQEGSILSIGAMREGMRGYLAVEGGVLSEPVLGSRSTHTRWKIGGLDGEALKAGQSVPVGSPADPTVCRTLATTAVSSWRGPVRVVLGPQDDLFTPAGLATFLSAEYRLSAKFDRMGCQLEGEAIAHARDFNIVSDAIAGGSIQVPGNGQPIILLADRQTTGGYAKIATVIGPDLRKVAQARPGELLRFETVDADAAERIAREEEDRACALLAAIEAHPATAALVPPDRWWTLDLLGGVAAARS